MSKIRRILWLLFIAGAVSTLFALGTWQLYRLQWKETKIPAYEKGLQMPAQPLSGFYPLTEEATFRRAAITGTWIKGKDLDLGGRRYNGQTGYQILTPFHTQDGKFILVNRGWVPTALKEEKARTDILTDEETTIEGMIRLPDKGGIFTPENHPKKNFWFTVDIPAMSKETKLTLEPLTLEIIQPNAPADSYPIPSDGKVVLRNDHLGYAITWYGIAIAAAVIGFLRFRKKPV